MVELANNDNLSSRDSMLTLIRKAKIKSNRLKYWMRMPLVHNEYR